MKHLPTAALALALALAGTSAAAAPDAAKGKQLFARCAICHATDRATVKLGPPLGAVVNRKAASFPGYAYSPAMKAAKISWTPQLLDKFLAAPRTVVPGTKMVFPGLPAAADRQNMLAYLKTLGPAPAAKARR